MKSNTENILGYEVEKNGTVCISTMMKWSLKKRKCRWMSCLNPHSYAVSIKDKEFSKALQDSDWLIPDGTGIVLASRFLGGKIRQRLTGDDVFMGLSQKLNAKGKFKIFFLGSSEKTLQAIKKRFEKEFPNLRVVGTFSPPFKPSFSEGELSAMAQAINKSKADVLWVGLTAPKQEKLIYQNRKRWKVRFAGAIGAVFDFYAGNIKRANPVFQKLGLEWLVRFVQEPRRLWRRYTISTSIFLWHVLKAKFSGTKD